MLLSINGYSEAMTDPKYKYYMNRSDYNIRREYARDDAPRVSFQWSKKTRVWQHFTDLVYQNTQWFEITEKLAFKVIRGEVSPEVSKLIKW